MYRTILHGAWACKEDLEQIKGKKVTEMSNYTDSDGKDGVSITFANEDGDTVDVTLDEDGQICISSEVNVSPVYAMQWFKDLIGYKIIDVESDSNDLNGHVYLQNDRENVVIMQLDNRVLDGESIYMITDKENNKEK